MEERKEILQENIDITHLSNFKTPAKAKYYFEINKENDVDLLAEVFDFAEKENCKTLIIGGGTNLLFAFDTFDGIIIKNNLSWWFYDESSKILISYSGEATWDIAKELEKEYKQKLWHRFIGLPGSIGGAVFWNAWCFGLEAENNFLEAEVYNKITKKRETLSKEKMIFEYRTSIVKKTEQYFIIKLVFDLAEKKEKYSSEVDNISFRETIQPKGNSGGSFFKNPSKEFSAGRLLEEVWLKWSHLKWAYFSEKHANFLMAGENCTWRDLIALIELAKKKVSEKFQIELESEVRIIFS